MINCVKIKWIFRGAVTALFALLAMASMAQCPVEQKVGSNYQFKAAGADSAQRVPNTRAFAHCWVTPGAIMYDSVAERYFKWETALGWVPMIDANEGLSDSADVIQLGRDSADTSHQGALGTVRKIENNSFFERIYSSLSGDMLASWQDFMDTITGQGTNGTTPLHIHQGQIGGGYFSAYDPYNFGQKYVTARVPGGVQIAGRTSSGYATEFNGLGTEGAPDNVFNFLQYNQNFNNGRTDTTDGAFRFAAETNFINSVEGTQWGFEFHIPETVEYDGHITRVNSIYTNKSNGAAHQVRYIVDDEYHTAWSGVDYTYGDIGGAGGTGANGLFIQSFGGPASSEDGTYSFFDASGVSSSMQGRGGFISIFTSGAPDKAFEMANSNAAVCQANTAVPSVGYFTVGSDPSDTFQPNSLTQFISKTRGITPPRMTTVQKLAIPVTATDEGIMVYDLTLHTMSYYNGTIWINF